MFPMSIFCQGLSEAICQHVCSVDIFDGYGASIDHVADVSLSNINVLGALVEHRIHQAP